MRQAKLWRYAVPMESGVVLRDRRLTQREGLLVQLQEGERQGWGEIAPLPGFSHETLTQAQQAGVAWLADWRAARPVAESHLPSVAFGLSCACAELRGELPEAASWQSAQLCQGDPDELLLQLAAQRPPCAKMKVGLYETARDAIQVALLLEALPTLPLRLDANRSWTLEKARRFADRLTPAQRARIAFIEEPCRTPEESLRFAAESGIAIAWDESLRQPDFQLSAQPGVVAVVIKPTLSGGIARLRHIVAGAQRLGLQVVISSALESSLGLTQLARLARWLTPHATPGLDTLSLMRQQLVRRWPGCELPLQEQGQWTRIC
ncbi:o-succinylbenzoate synthase [Mixta tenebrionis]|uniref:o-succinylbenzoate synthase n=1 Tax=Mixta tenebrionis TaxID=2562439 RepID=A0A506VAV8_9GAMM|nr:o-succinylbenzoate synthase [Mixta tenebrionis]TPW42867.1 o-succinylbenzoate synthase [Mixta tenebrionis]